jgi:hypothetical protein
MFSDPDFIYIYVTANVKVSKTLQKYSILDLRTKTVNAIKAYNTNNLKDFAAKFRYSKFMSTIDTVDASIVGNEVDVRLVKRHYPILNTADHKSLLYSNAIKSGSITSSLFYYTYAGESRDSRIIDVDGTLKITSATATGYEVTNPNIGTIDYVTGKMNLTGFNITGYEGTSIKITATPTYHDLSSVYNQVLEIDEEYGLNVMLTQEAN